MFFPEHFTLMENVMRSTEDVKENSTFRESLKLQPLKVHILGNSSLMIN